MDTDEAKNFVNTLSDDLDISRNNDPVSSEIKILSRILLGLFEFLIDWREDQIEEQERHK